MHLRSLLAFGCALTIMATAAVAQTRDQTITAIQATQQTGGNIAGTAGPETPVLEQPTAAETGTDYLRDLALKPLAFEEDLVRVVARFAKLNPDWGTTASPETAGPNDRAWLDILIERLRNEKILAPEDKIFPAQELRRGNAALLFARVLHLGGGITGGLFGLSRRAAYHELAEMRIIAGGGEHHRMSGAELIELADNAFEYQTTMNPVKVAK